MKIKIDPEPFVICELDVRKFEVDFKKTMKLKDSVMKNLKIVFNRFTPKENEAKALEIIYLGTDWGNIFMLYDLGVPDVVQFSAYYCEINGLYTYKPYKKDTYNNTIETKDEAITKNEFIVTNSFNPKLDKHIEYTLSQYLIDYVNFDWKTIVVLEDQK